MSTQERCANAFRIWTAQIRKMLIEAGETNAAARVDNYSFETFHAGWHAGEATTIDRCIRAIEMQEGWNAGARASIAAIRALAKENPC